MIWYGSRCDWYIVMYEMIMFCIMATGRSLTVVLLLHDCESLSLVIVLLLWVSTSNSCCRWRTTTRRYRGPRRHAGELIEIKPGAQDGDHGAKKKTISYYIELHVMLIRLRILFCFDCDSSIIRWSLGFNIKMCSSIVCTIAKVRRFEASRDDRVW